VQVDVVGQSLSIPFQILFVPTSRVSRRPQQNETVSTPFIRRLNISTSGFIVDAYNS
ncbi:hypothetical protein Bpfe_008003, partial [Biomphalaria pfeifferi]